MIDKNIKEQNSIAQADTTRKENNTVNVGEIAQSPTNEKTATMDIANLSKIIEALLFAENNPLTLTRLNEITAAPPETILEVISQLNKEYESTQRTFRIEKVANGYQLYTIPEFGQWVRLLYKSSYHRLSRPALEILAIIVYNQPITRQEIEKLRGVDCSGPIFTLLERKLVRIEGRAKKPGGPFLYGTGKEFLRYFGLASLNELPDKEQLSAFLQKRGEET